MELDGRTIRVNEAQLKGEFERGMREGDSELSDFLNTTRGSHMP